MKNSTPLGRFLQKGRLNVSLSQTDVSRFLGYSSGQIVSNWERSEQSVPSEKVGEIAKLYQMSEPEKHRFIELLVSKQVDHMAALMNLKSGSKPVDNLLAG